CIHQVIQKVQRAPICPVNIFKKHHAYLLTCDLRAELLSVMEGEIMNLPGISKNTFQVSAGGIVQPNQVTDEMSIEGGSFLISHIAENPALQLFTGNRGTIVI